MSTRYTIVTPDGKRITISGPDDATDDELVGIAQDYLASSGSRYAKGRVNVARPVAAPTISPAEPTELRPAVQSALDRRNAFAQPGEGVLSQITQGATFGLSDEVTGVAGALDNVVRSALGSVNFAPAQAYRDARDGERAYLDQVSEASPLSSLAGNVVGGFVGAGPKALATVLETAPSALSAIGTAVKQGATQGALAGYGGGDGIAGSALSALGGAGFGGALSAVAPTAFSYAKRAYEGAQRFVGRDSAGLARQIVGRAMQADALLPDEAAQRITAARALGVPLAPADLGSNLRGRLASVARQPGPARTVATEFVENRQRTQGARVRDAIARDLGPLTNQPEQALQLRDAARIAAQDATTAASDNLTATVEAVAPAIDRLGSGGQARDAFETAYTAAKRRSSDAYNAPVLVNAQPLEIPGSFFSKDVRAAADRFYGDGGGYVPSEVQTIIDDLAAEGGTTRTLTNIDRRLADFAGGARMAGRNQEAAFAETVRRDLSTFADRAAPAEYRAALANAKAVRAEQGRLYETRDVPRTFANDRYGNPVVGDTAIPGRLFRAGAPGGDTADSLIAAVGPERAEQIAREEVRRVLEEGGEITPQAFASFNRRFGETLGRFPSLQRDLAAVSAGAETLTAARAAQEVAGRPGSTALERGAAAINNTANELGVAVAPLSEADGALFRQGYRNELADRVSSRIHGADKGYALANTDERIEALRRLFPGEDLARFEKTLALESAASQTRGLISTGSRTAENQAFDAQTGDAGLLEEATGAVIRGARNGGFPGIMAELFGRLKTGWREGAGKAGEAVRQDIATLLTQSDPALLVEALKEANRAASAAALGQRNALTIGAGAGVGGGVGLVTAGTATNGR